MRTTGSHNTASRVPLDPTLDPIFVGAARAVGGAQLFFFSLICGAGESLFSHPPHTHRTRDKDDDVDYNHYYSYSYWSDYTIMMMKT